MITRREQEMLDLHDEGLSRDKIAARMGIKVGSVTRTLSALNGNAGNGDQRAIARATANLLAAIQRHHPEQLLSRVRARS